MAGSRTPKGRKKNTGPKSGAHPRTQVRTSKLPRAEGGPTLEDLRQHLERAGLPWRHTYVQPGPEGSFGPYLRQERVTRGWTQAELGRRANLTQAQISSYELGVHRFPDIGALARLDDAFGLPRGTLLGMAGWQAAAKRVELQAPEGALIVPEPTGPMVELFEIAKGMTPEQLARLLALAHTMRDHPAADSGANGDPVDIDMPSAGLPESGPPDMDASAEA